MYTLQVHVIHLFTSTDEIWVSDEKGPQIQSQQRNEVEFLNLQSM